MHSAQVSAFELLAVADVDAHRGQTATQALQSTQSPSGSAPWARRLLGVAAARFAAPVHCRVTTSEFSSSMAAWMRGQGQHVDAHPARASVRRRHRSWRSGWRTVM